MSNETKVQKSYWLTCVLRRPLIHEIKKMFLTSSRERKKVIQKNVIQKMLFRKMLFRILFEGESKKMFS